MAELTAIYAKVRSEYILLKNSVFKRRFSISKALLIAD